MPESTTTKRRRDLLVVGAALLASLALAALIGVGLVFWQQLEQAKSDRYALAEQVRQLGGQPVAEGKPGDRGEPGPQGERGPQGPQGPQGPEGKPGAQGRPGINGVDGRSPACLLTANACTGPTGPAGADGTDGKDGAQGKDGAAGRDGVDGEDGVDGKDGAPCDPAVNPNCIGPVGAEGRGIADMDCNPDTGRWAVLYTKGANSTEGDRADGGPCIYREPTLPVRGR
jgi:hypothetical protein